MPNPLNSQSFNRYSYVANNPVNFVDPSGNNEYSVENIPRPPTFSIEPQYNNNATSAFQQATLNGLKSQGVSNLNNSNISVPVGIKKQYSSAATNAIINAGILVASDPALPTSNVNFRVTPSNKLFPMARAVYQGYLKEPFASNATYKFQVATTVGNLLSGASAIVALNEAYVAVLNRDFNQFGLGVYHFGINAAGLFPPLKVVPLVGYSLEAGIIESNHILRKAAETKTYYNKRPDEFLNCLTVGCF